MNGQLVYFFGKTPDLFTSNPKWPNFVEMMAFVPVHISHDRPEVTPLTYVIEFQKRNPPHALILLLLEEEWKCKTPDQIDDIMSTEIPSLTHDPDGYKVVTEYMLHGSYGKCAACTVDGKCSKRFLKAFYAETMIDEDGYLIYRRRD
ncbi:hypothetical protein Tco_0803629 [Tanacetum coccineum]|uniref:Uncharacterized protein n=1 Tax=Tanacetum coccineum TaxID=301880 RepID=A0ABQ5A4U9_9ASTR